MAARSGIAGAAIAVRPVTLLVILRPEPGASRTAAAAAAMGLQPVAAPIFRLEPLPWRVPAHAFDAVVMTSGNAARLGGAGIAAFTALPCYAVGDTTATEARKAGFSDVRTGASDGAALVRQIEADGITCALHLCGREHKCLEAIAVTILSQPVYAAEANDVLSGQAITALAAGKALVLIHSPRAGALFAVLSDRSGVPRDHVRIAAISRAAADAAGPGWQAIGIAAKPRDEALLELAVKLCKTEALGTRMAR